MVLRYPDASASQGKTTSDTDVVEARFIEIIPDVKVTNAVNFVADDGCFLGQAGCISRERDSAEHRVRMKGSLDNDNRRHPVWSGPGR